MPVLNRTRGTLIRLVAIGLFYSAMHTAAFAAADVQKRGQGFLLTAENASAKDALDALSKFDVKYTMRSDNGRRISGQYSGEINHLLTRILDGYDYIVTHSQNQIEVVVLGLSSATDQSLLAATAPPSVKQVAARSTERMVVPPAPPHNSAAVAATIDSVPPLTSFLSTQNSPGTSGP
jgi:hypothetical protein